MLSKRAVPVDDVFDVVVAVPCADVTYLHSSSLDVLNCHAIVVALGFPASNVAVNLACSPSSTTLSEGFDVIEGGQ